MTNDKTVTMSRELAERISARLERLNAGFCELRALLAAPVVERQPYGYWICPKGNPNLGSFHHEVLDTTEQYCEVTPLFASPPAPVAVVLPDYRKPAFYFSRVGNCALAVDLADEWSACIDKVKELNQ